jgi:hypothetical protein
LAENLIARMQSQTFVYVKIHIDGSPEIALPPHPFKLLSSPCVVWISAAGFSFHLPLVT